ncbi:MAG: sugar phosphate isomerase/epimerase [Victivallales bacterium]|nr:sugar phosphate isomerase/epimerase [Victivallales bacterium]
MLKTGLVSISFRKLAVDEIIRLVADAGLDSIEWGGDVHVPHGDTKKAADTRQKTMSAGLECAAYGSYYKLAASENDGLPFDSVLDTAEALGAPCIRVWAGKCGSKEASPELRALIVKDAVRVANSAAERGLEVALEYHSGTLTDTNESAKSLLKEIAHPNLLSYWQTPSHMDFGQRMDSLLSILPKLANIHVFHWSLNNSVIERYPLAEGENDWIRYLQALPKEARIRHALLEYFKDDDIEQFKKDAETLKRWVGKIAKQP